MYERTKQLLEEFKDRISEVEEEIQEEETKHNKSKVTLVAPGPYVARIEEIACKGGPNLSSPFIGIKYYIEEAKTHIWQWEIGSPSLLPLLKYKKGTKVPVRVETRTYVPQNGDDAQQVNIVRPMP